MKCPESVAAVSHTCLAEGANSGSEVGLLSMISSRCTFVACISYAASRQVVLKYVGGAYC